MLLWFTAVKVCVQTGFGAEEPICSAFHSSVCAYQNCLFMIPSKTDQKHTPKHKRWNPTAICLCVLVKYKSITTIKHKRWTSTAALWNRTPGMWRTLRLTHNAKAAYLYASL